MTSGRNLWSLDEYVVVADLFLRRGRSSGVRDPEVLALARLTGRTPASISRRLGNFAGTNTPGVGLKPVTGEALAAFEAMQRDESVRARMVQDARARLVALTNHEPDRSSTWRLVPPEEANVERFQRTLDVTSGDGVRREAELVRRYLHWRDEDGTRLFGVVIPVGDQLLRADLYDRELDLLIEAKADAGRDSVRHAIGQLFDYRRCFDSAPRLAVLLPLEPEGDLIALLTELEINAIWPEEDRFVDSCEGACVAANGNAREP